MTRVVLASASAIRRRLLQDAGVRFDVDPADLDEASIKTVARQQGLTAEEAARVLAEAKAATVARHRPGCLVIGADQMLECEGRWLDKPASREEARDTLLLLRGRTHRLITAVAVLRNECLVWSEVAVAVLRLRTFSERFLDDYLDIVGDDAMTSVGACKLEGIGIQFFAEVQGDFFTILGLPLLPLLDVLRAEGVLQR